MTEDQAGSVEERAEHLLQSGRLVPLAVRFTERRGVMGEDHNKLTLLLACVGGILGDPIHCIVHGASASGKNTLVRSITDLLPPDKLLCVSGMSSHALAYSDEDIDGVLVIDEAAGFSGAAEYSLRTVMSEGKISRLTVIKGQGGQNKGKRLDVNVTASVITTTTSTALHAENQTRVFDLWTDETEGLTRRINLDLGRRQAGGHPSADFAEELEMWRMALSMLEPHDVVIPYATELANLFPSSPIRSRRDLPRVFSLIRAHALLHQRQRERGSEDTLIATLTDSMTGLTKTAFEIDAGLQRLFNTGNDWIRRTDLERVLKEAGGPSHNTVRKWAPRLIELGFWEGQMRSGAWEYRPVRDAASEPVTLPRPDELPEPTSGYQSVAGRQIRISGNDLPQSTKCTSTERKQAMETSVVDQTSPHWDDWEEEGNSTLLEDEEPTTCQLGGTGRIGSSAEESLQDSSPTLDERKPIRD